MTRRFIIVPAAITILLGTAAAIYYHLKQNDLNTRPAVSSSAPTGHTDNRVRTPVHVYFADNTLEYLVSEIRSIVVSDDPASKGKGIIEQLIRGPGKNLTQTLPANTVLRDFFIAEDGTAYVDFSDELTVGHPGGVQMELLTLYAIVNSLVFNIDQIDKVKLLVNGREATTLAGHIDIRYPYKANMLLVK